jgi:hypothetical protein
LIWAPKAPIGTEMSETRSEQTGLACAWSGPRELNSLPVTELRNPMTKQNYSSSGDVPHSFLGKQVWFDLKKDPRETKDLAASQLEVVAKMRGRYDAFVATLPPLKPSADYKGGGQVPKGWGWEIGDGK